MLAFGVRLASFPYDDEAFAAFVNGCSAELALDERADPLELQCRIRRQYRFAVIRAQTDRGAPGEPTWHVYRDGEPSLNRDSDWWTAPNAARVIFDTEWTFVEADPDAAALVGLGSGALAGKSWWDILPPAARDRVASSVGTLGNCGWVQSEFDCPLPDGRLRVIEYRIQRAPDPGRFVSLWRRSSPDMARRGARLEASPWLTDPARRLPMG